MEIEKKVIALIRKKNVILAEINAYHLNRTGKESSDAQGRLEFLQKRLHLIDTWFLLLNTDQQFVVERHLIKGMAWPTLTSEYEIRWPAVPKVERTLVRKQAEAIDKIVAFTMIHLSEIGYLLDDAVE